MAVSIHLPFKLALKRLLLIAIIKRTNYLFVDNRYKNKYSKFRNTDPRASFKNDNSNFILLLPQFCHLERTTRFKSAMFKQNNPGTSVVPSYQLFPPKG